LKTYFPQVCGGDQPYMGPEVLEREHNRIRERAIHIFHSARKMGGPEFSRTYEEQLVAEVLELYQNYIKHNESKNIFAAARTPAVLFAIMVVCYMVSGLFGVIGLETIANFFNLIMGIALLLLSTWAYVRYSGDYRDVGVQIDSLAELIWEQVGPALKQQARSVVTLSQKDRRRLARKKRH
jgi:atlastin